ncbi:unnamed protein product, partial [Polarella glacialis]
LFESPLIFSLLGHLPAKALAALACCGASLRHEVEGAEGIWSTRVEADFGGSVADATLRFSCQVDRGRVEGEEGPWKPQASDIFRRLARLRKALMRNARVVRGDLRNARQLGVDAVACPAVPSLEPYGPAARAVYAEAGEELTHYIEEHECSLRVGQACWTPGFGLGVAGLIHVVGPDQSTVDGDRVLRQAYSGAFACALQHGAKSIAIGSISTGGNGFSAKAAALIAAEEIRDAFVAGLSQVVMVAFEEDVADAFTMALAKLASRVQADLLERLPLMVLDTMLPRQRLRCTIREGILPANCERFAMLGMVPGASRVMNHGVEVSIVSRTTQASGQVGIEVVAGRRFRCPGHPQRESRSADVVVVSVEWLDADWMPEEELEPLVVLAKELEAQVELWLQLVRQGERERFPGHIDQVLQDLGPMPPVGEPADRAFWVAALINLLPGLGVAMEIRPAMLLAGSVAQMLAIAGEGLQASIVHLQAPG